MNKKSTQRELVTRKRFNTSADKDLLIKLDELSENTLIPKSKLIDKALGLLFEEYEIDHELPNEKMRVISFKHIKKD